MHQFEKLYVEQINLLKEKGYDSTGINKHFVTVDYLGRLLLKFLQAYQKSEKTNQPSLFSVSNTCFHSQSGEHLKIVFNYLYEPKQMTLSIKNLYVVMKGVTGTFNVKTKDDLPTPDFLVNEMDASYNNHPKKKLDEFQQSIDKHTDLLLQRGFDQTTLGNDEPITAYIDRVMDALKNGLLENIAHPNLPFSFSVSTARSVPGLTNPMQFEFGYHYNPQDAVLRLIRLTATLEKESKVFVVGSENDLPHSTMIYESFLENRQLASKIIPALQERYCAMKENRQRLL